MREIEEAIQRRMRDQLRRSMEEMMMMVKTPTLQESINDVMALPNFYHRYGFRKFPTQSGGIIEVFVKRELDETVHFEVSFRNIDFITAFKIPAEAYDHVARNDLVMESLKDYIIKQLKIHYL